METLLDLDGQRRLMEYLTQIGDVLHYVKRRASFATYALGLLGDGERKSVEPIAARACADPAEMDAAHPRLLHFLSDSEWSDRDVRRIAARHAISEMTARAPIDSWIIDDSGFLKQGTGFNDRSSPLPLRANTPMVVNVDAPEQMADQTIPLLARLRISAPRPIRKSTRAPHRASCRCSIRSPNSSTEAPCRRWVTSSMARARVTTPEPTVRRARR